MRTISRELKRARRGLSRKVSQETRGSRAGLYRGSSREEEHAAEGGHGRAEVLRMRGHDVEREARDPPAQLREDIKPPPWGEYTRKRRREKLFAGASRHVLPELVAVCVGAGGGQQPASILLLPLVLLLLLLSMMF